MLALRGDSCQVALRIKGFCVELDVGSFGRLTSICLDCYDYYQQLQVRSADTLAGWERRMPLKNTFQVVRLIVASLQFLPLAVMFAPMLAWATPERPSQSADSTDVSQLDVSLLIEQLGSSDFTLREAATTQTPGVF